MFWHSRAPRLMARIPLKNCPIRLTQGILGALLYLFYAYFHDSGVHNLFQNEMQHVHRHASHLITLAAPLLPGSCLQALTGRLWPGAAVVGLGASRVAPLSRAVAGQALRALHLRCVRLRRGAIFVVLLLWITSGKGRLYYFPIIPFCG